MTVHKLKINTNIVNNDNLERKLFYALACTLLILFASYVYFLGSITFNIVQRNSFNADIRNLSSTIGGLEQEYLSLSSNIDLRLADNLGFKETKKSHFVSREPLARNLSFRSDGI